MGSELFIFFLAFILIVLFLLFTSEKHFIRNMVFRELIFIIFGLFFIIWG